jgi:drug/metabolite transporter (DMT)-like permease
MAIGAAARAPDRQMRGIALLLAAVAFLPAMDAIAKSLTARYDVLQITWARFFFASLVLLPFLRSRAGRASLVPPRLGLHLARSVCQVAGVALFFLTLSYLPLGDTVALCFLYPIFTLVLAAAMLGEVVGSRRWLAVLVAFIGALVIIRPGLSVFQPASLLGLLTSLVYAVFLVLTRRLAGSAPAVVMLLWGTMVGTVLTTLLLPFSWHTPTPIDLAGMFAMGVIGAVGHLLILKAYEAAPASLLSPLGYGEILGATALGWAVFGDVPDAATWLGIAIIIGSGVYLATTAQGLPKRRVLSAPASR